MTVSTMTGSTRAPVYAAARGVRIESTPAGEVRAQPRIGGERGVRSADGRGRVETRERDSLGGARGEALSGPADPDCQPHGVAVLAVAHELARDRRLAAEGPA